MENTNQNLTPEAAAEAAKKIDGIVRNVGTVIIGKDEVVRLVIMALLAEGHVLIEDVPGVGKTSLAAAVARSIDCGFQRIQFTPDLMPSDITGFSIYNQKSGEFEFRKGAVMNNLILADEINRASAKTQASLLEAMEEKQVTVDSHTYRLEEPFMVLATQNPIESYGTYPLPDAQLDRFMIKVSMGYPTLEQEVDVLYARGKKSDPLKPVASVQDILDLRRMAENVTVERVLGRYIVQIIRAIRSHSDVLLGCSPRGGIALFRGARVYALMKGRNYVIPDDIVYLAPYTLSHRIILSSEAQLQQKTTQDIIREVLGKIEVVLDHRDDNPEPEKEKPSHLWSGRK
jgi:MoxR-like ATPase